MNEEDREQAAKNSGHWLIAALPEEAMEECLETLAKIYEFWKDQLKKGSDSCVT